MAQSTNKLFGHVEGQWYKGALHCHSTQSDGQQSPEEVVAWYRSRGYDFMSLTDHRTITEVEGDDDFLCIPGVELNTNGVREGKLGLYHIVGIGVDPTCDCSVNDDPQHLIDAIVAAGGLAFIAHPKWSGNVIDSEFRQLRGYTGIECYNHACEVTNYTGTSSSHWDMLSLTGNRTLGFATDDAHVMDAHGGGGWVMVKAPSLTHEAIMDAMRQGHFYSSSGPEIHDIFIEDDVVNVKCSPAAEVRFVTGGPGASVVRKSTDESGKSVLLESASHRFRGKGSFGEEAFIRIEVVDDEGRVAWSQLIHP